MVTQIVAKAAVAGHQLPQNPAATWEESSRAVAFSSFQQLSS